MKVILAVLCLMFCEICVTGQQMNRVFSFGTDGKFRVCQISDIQDIYPIRENTLNFLRRGLEIYRPDLIILTGDNTEQYNGKGDFEKTIVCFLEIFCDAKIPFAVTFGNHDSQQKGEGVYTRQEQYDIYKKMGGELFVDFDVPELSGTGNGAIPIFAAGTGKGKSAPLFQLVVMDSGDYAASGGYDGCRSDQIRWYEENAGKIPCLWFQHIVVPDINTTGLLQHVAPREAVIARIDVTETTANDVNGFLSEPLGKYIKKLPGNAIWSKQLGCYIIPEPNMVWVEARGKYFVAPEGTIYNTPTGTFDKLADGVLGELAEHPCPPAISVYTDEEHTWQGRTLYQSWQKMGNMRGAYFGHDHKNTYDGTDRNGIRMGSCKAATLYDYNDGNPGFRIFDISTDATYRTETVTARQLGVIK